jgi:hypothetical protein
MLVIEKTRRKPWPCFMYSSLDGCGVSVGSFGDVVGVEEDVWWWVGGLEPRFTSLPLGIVSFKLIAEHNGTG